MRHRFAMTTAAAVLAGSAFLVMPAPNASADPLVCVNFGGFDSIAAPPVGGGACLPPEGFDFLNFGLPTIFVDIPDLFSLLSSIPFPVIPLPTVPFPTDSGAVVSDGTTVIDDSSQPPVTDTAGTADAPARAAAAPAFFPSTGAPSIDAAFSRVNQTLSDLSTRAVDSSSTGSTSSDGLNNALGGITTSINGLLSGINSILSPTTS